EAKRLLDGLLWYVRNPTKHLDGDRIRGYAREGDLYQLARPVRNDIQAVWVAYRLTGIAEFRDYAVNLMQLAEGSLRVGWRNHDVSAVPATGPSPFRCWPTFGGGQPPRLYGTDLSTMNEIRWHATIAEVARACIETGHPDGAKWLA